MEIDKIKDKKQELGNTIDKMIKDFNKETGCIVKEINIKSLDIRSPGSESVYIFEGIEVKVELE